MAKKVNGIVYYLVDVVAVGDEIIVIYESDYGKQIKIKHYIY